MAGTKSGGAKARETNIKLYGEDYYRKIGAEGGKKGRTGGFYYSKVNGLDTHITAGKKGGTISRRKKSEAL